MANDDIVILESIARKLRKFGFRVFTANSGDGALSLYNKFYPELVIIDEDLKKIDGLQLFLRLFFCNPSIKLLLTTHDEQPIENSEFDESNFVVIKKRFSGEELKQIFKNIKFVTEQHQEDFQ